MQPITKTVSLLVLTISGILGLWYYLNPIFQPTPLNLRNATIISSTKTIGAFNLIDTNNATFSTNNLRGQWTLLFFGYTDCPDICPSTLTIMRDTWNKFNAAPAKFVFVNINPNSKEPTEVKQFLQRFHPDFIGATGDSDAVKQLSDQLGVFAKLTDDNGIIDHTSALMLINPHGKLHAILTPPFEPLALAEDLITITKASTNILK